MLSEKDSFNPLLFVVSILLLGIGFYLYLALRPVPEDLETYSFFANLRSLKDSKQFYTPEEIFPIFLLHYWKLIFRFNDLTALQTLVAIIYSCCLHLILFIFQKSKWSRNHYLLVYLSSLLPFSHEFPITYYTELISLFFILILYHKFRFETILDLFFVPFVFILAFFSDLRFFIFGFTIVASVLGIKAAVQFKNKTTVFYKRKNIPLLILLFYYILLIISFIVFSITHFFGENSLSSLFKYYGTILLHLGPVWIVIGIGNLLLKTEKELQTYTFSLILLAGISLLIFWNYSHYNKDKFASLYRDADAIYRVRGFLLESEIVFLPPGLSNYLYYNYNYPTQHINIKPNLKSMIYVDDLWQADLNELQRNYSQRKKKSNLPDFIAVHDNSAFISYEIEEKILSDKTNHPIKKKIIDARQNLKENTPYIYYLVWQIKQAGYTCFQK